jgi:hypothetical protein
MNIHAVIRKGIGFGSMATATCGYISIIRGLVRNIAARMPTRYLQFNRFKK